MNILYYLPKHVVACLFAAFFLSSITYAQVVSWSEDFSSDPTGLTWFEHENSDTSNPDSGASYDAAGEKFILNAFDNASGSPRWGRNGTGSTLPFGSTVDSYDVEVTVELINFIGGVAASDLTITTNGMDGRTQFKINPWGVITLSHVDFEQGDDGWTQNNGYTIQDIGSSFASNGDLVTFKFSYDGTADSITYYYSVNGSADTLIYTATAATDSAGGYGFYDTITGIRWETDKRQAVDVGLYQWGSPRDAAGSVAITNISVTANTIADADDDGVADEEDAHPGYNDAELTAYLDTWLTENGYSNDGSGGGDGSGGLTQQDFLDARVGSTAVSITDAEDGRSATITLQVEQSDDNMQTWSSPSAGSATVDLPVSGDATFFRVRAQ